MEIIIEQEELLQKSKEFKLFSGPVLTRIFNKTGVAGYEIGTLGSAGLLKYKDRFFVVTAKHVVTLNNELIPLADIVIPYQYQGGTKALTLLKQAVDSDRDIAIFEVAQTSAEFMEQEQNNCFLEDGLIYEDPLGYFEKKCNVVFLHGISKQETELDYDAYVVDMTTTPYTTFIDRVDEASERIVLMADVDGTNEFGQPGHPLPDFSGMSGSFAYSYQREDTENPFRLLGILSNGNKEAGFLWVIPISEAVEILEKEFFSN
ncbi:hypothetical protein P4H66_30495 [Paenibacillus dokdonensis]|uniref:Serine protease n=1 Tax=Paenibacillus dokdonensis TaxID=2567944 RepID=A0ABU6GWM9_9BACL|nr:hypothetical protein [Paenibacillus dokdonensis]MEC0244146.1 hypothetical protein [Paenibacillus dokdonensis]